MAEKDQSQHPEYNRIDEESGDLLAQEAEKKTQKKQDAAKVSQGRINVSIEPDEPQGLTTSLKQIQDKANNLSRMSEQGIVNEITGSAVVVRTDGQINLTPSKYASVHLSPNGRIVDQSMESETIANRKKFTVDEILVNEHKLNPQLWELADMRAQKLLINQNVVVGNLTLSGHVLVKAWEPNLKRYMLIRRPWRGPMFGPLLNVPEINESIQVNDPLKLNEDILALSDKGYQVNGIIKDAKSLIGKSGVDREGSASRTEDAMNGRGTGSSSNAASGTQVTATADKKSIFDALIKLGYNAIAACGIMGNIQQECSFNVKSGISGGAACGLFQWGNNCDGSRWQKLCSYYPDPACWDAGNQISFMFREVEEGYSNLMPASLNSASSPEEAAVIFEETFERAGVPELGKRKSYARQFYDLYGKS